MKHVIVIDLKDVTKDYCDAADGLKLTSIPTAKLVPGMLSFLFKDSVKTSVNHILQWLQDIGVVEEFMYALDTLVELTYVYLISIDDEINKKGIVNNETELSFAITCTKNYQLYIAASSWSNNTGSQ